jgi:hypothetical protein
MFRKMVAQPPLEHLFIDIKYMGIQEAYKNAVLLIVIDVYTRKGAIQRPERMYCWKEKHRSPFGKKNKSRYPTILQTD